MANNSNGSTCLASSTPNFELPSKFSSGSFTVLLSNTHKNTISETDTAYDFKMPKHSGEPKTEKLPKCNFSPFHFPGQFSFSPLNFHILGQFSVSGSLMEGPFFHPCSPDSHYEALWVCSLIPPRRYCATDDHYFLLIFRMIMKNTPFLKQPLR